MDHPSELQLEDRPLEVETACVDAPDTYRSEESVAYRMNQVRLLLCGVIDKKLAANGLSALQWGLLKALFDGRARTPTALCRILLSDSSAMTRQLDFLEKRGYIRRVRNESDRRSVYLMLTDAGRAVTCETLPLIVETRDRQLRGFTGDEVNTLKQFMDRMIDNLS
ncbi:MarR family winged helix-turn-helix transcriptional regulator [Paraburkholderia elongata]|nr:MarR family transcriptional regulator [Paraburkholderia elongata]